MAYNIQQVTRMAGISKQTLRFYDERGLLEAKRNKNNGYRFYEEADLLKLQQILLYREMDLSLEQIRNLLNRPGLDILATLTEHRGALQERASRISRLIITIEKTLQHLQGELKMDEKAFFEGFSEEQQELYALEAGQRWGEDRVAESMANWKYLTTAEKDDLMAEGNAVISAFVEMIGTPPEDAGVQALAGRWHHHMERFTPCPLEMLHGLGTLYTDDPRFRQTFSRMHPDLPEYLRSALHVYCRNAGYTGG